MIENYRLKFKSRGKFVFVPTQLCVKKAERVLAFGKTLALPEYFFHYQPGGHVGALYRHLKNTHFFRIDLKNFF
jgi:hypothetical protein